MFHFFLCIAVNMHHSKRASIMNYDIYCKHIIMPIMISAVVCSGGKNIFNVGESKRLFRQGEAPVGPGSQG